MTKEEFNSLPLEARSFIENNTGCLACGNSETKLDRAFALYQNNKKMETYQLFGGGINYKSGEETGVLYNLSKEDTPFEIKEKIRIAKAIHKVRPHSFKIYNLEAMTALIESLPKTEVVDLDILEKPISSKQKRLIKKGKI